MQHKKIIIEPYNHTWMHAFSAHTCIFSSNLAFIIHPSKRVCPTAMPTRPSARQILSQICGVWSDDKYYNTYTIALDDGELESCSVHTIEPSGWEIFSKKLITIANDGRIFWGAHQQYELIADLHEKPDFMRWQSKTGNWRHDFKWKRHEDKTPSLVRLAAFKIVACDAIGSDSPMPS